jgi:glycosyltransferase involved in cell wall biosynthesis
MAEGKQPGQTPREAREHERGCVIVPAFRESEHIAEVVRRIREHMPDVIVVDDGSGDDTAARAEEADAVVLRHEENQGKGMAINTGFEYAREHGFDYVITMDADGQHAPAEIPRFVEAYVRTGIPVLVGNRMGDVEHMPLVRKWTNQFMSWLLSREMRQYVPDTQCGYRLYRASVIPFVYAEAPRYAAESEILLNVAGRGIRIDSVPISTIYGDEASQIHPVKDTIRFFWMLWQTRRERKRKQEGSLF